MFIVKWNITGGCETVVYDVRNDKTGYPQFLVYTNDQWTWISAKNFIPN